MSWDELLNWQEYMKLFGGLLAIVNPIAAVPIFMGLSKNLSSKEKNHVAFIATFSAALTLILFTFLGENVLGFFSITIEAFRIAGGLLLLLLALDMMRASKYHDKPVIEDVKTIGLLPLAIPLLAGPGAISTVIIYTHKHTSFSHDLLVVSVIVSVLMLAYILLRGASVIEKVIGDVGLKVFNRIMGLIIASMAIEFIIDGLFHHYQKLQHLLTVG